MTTARKSRAQRAAPHFPVTPAVGKAGEALFSRGPGESESRTRARVLLNPTLRTAFAAQGLDKSIGDTDLMAVTAELGEQVRRVHDGDLSRAEAMLTVQAHALDVLFGVLLRRAAVNMEENLGATDTYLRLAMKAQTQARATVETLVRIKQPRAVAFVQQANIAHGPQQVNNGPMPTDVSHADGRPANAPNRLLAGARDGQGLDGGTSSEAGRANSYLAPMGAIDRTKDSSGQSSNKPQR